jgi:hypothetical protein
MSGLEQNERFERNERFGADRSRTSVLEHFEQNAIALIECVGDDESVRTA